MSGVYSPDDVRDPDRRWVAVPKPRTLQETIRAEILNALAYTDGAQRKAAKLLGLSPTGIRYAMVKHGIPSAEAASVDAIKNRRHRAKAHSGARTPKGN